MAKAKFHRLFNATDAKRGVSLRIHPHDDFRPYPAWVIKLAETSGAATKYVAPKKPADTSGE
ncbi:hypothetical protein [Thioclava sp. GXIMD2076]|uniref:hypothetical protein n=1 Tax=Thioclava sp. GXIMD2076 TaxID=3131931 RepID=UPI0030D211C2